MAEILRFARPEGVPHPKTVKLSLDPPPSEDPHTFFQKILRLWSISAERRCGARWCREVTKNLAAYFDARVAMGADIGRKDR